MMTDGGPITPSNSLHGVALLSLPLAEITGGQIAYFAGKALTTWGDADDYRYFLPRILELATQPDEQSGWVNLEIIVGKLEYARWRRWPEAEQRAIDEFLTAWWSATVHEYRRAPEAATTISAIARVTDIDSFLPILNGALSNLAGRRAAADVVSAHWGRTYENMTRYRPPWHNAAWWDEQPERFLVLLKYVFGSEVGTALQNDFFDEVLEPRASEIARLRDHISWYRTAQPAILSYLLNNRWAVLGREIIKERQEADDGT